MNLLKQVYRYQLLQGEPNQDRVVVMQKDAEGNGYSPLHGTWVGAYRAESTWYGDAGLETLDAEHEDAGFTEDDIVDGNPALILTPVEAVIRGHEGMTYVVRRALGGFEYLWQDGSWHLNHAYYWPTRAAAEQFLRAHAEQEAGEGVIPAQGDE